MESSSGPDLEQSIDAEIEALIEQRNAAREARNFAESDRIRDLLLVPRDHSRGHAGPGAVAENVTLSSADSLISPLDSSISPRDSSISPRNSI